MNKEAFLIHPELSYKIIGIAFDIYNELGWGHDEKIYQSAFAKALTDANLKYEKEKYIPIDFRGQRIAKKFLDFVVENKIVLEFKIAPRLHPHKSSQILSEVSKSRIGYFNLFSTRWSKIQANN
jgi:GxxExxY protein